jgi:flagellin-like hook-associated protein FlgL
MDSGTYGSVATYSTTGGTNASSSNFEGDFDGDGDLDLLTVNPTNVYTIRLGNGDGTFGAAQTFAGNGNSYLTGDIDDDGDDDLIINDKTNTWSDVYQSDGDGTFTITQTGLMDGASGFSGGLYDIDGDGDLDMIVTDQSNALVYRSNGDGTFTLTMSSSIAVDRIAGVTDIDGDGDLDFITHDTIEGGGVFTNDGSGNYTMVSTFAGTGSKNVLVTGDYDNDGFNDFVTLTTTNEVLTLFTEDTSVGVGSPAVPATTVYTSGNQIGVEQVAQGLPQLIDVIDGAIEKLEGEMGKLAAAHTRLEAAQAHSLIMAETLEEAQANITDTDIALNVADVVMKQMLMDAQMSVMTQANVQLQTVLALLP